MNPQTLSYLRTLDYESMVKIFHQNCSKCSFRIVKLISDAGREKDYSQIPYEDVLRILTLAPASIIMQRGCSFGGDEFSLREIIINTCRFWKDSCIEGGNENQDNKPDAFIEIEEIIVKGNIDVSNREECFDKVISQ